MSADWDCASDNLAPRAQAEPGSTTMALVNAAVWLISKPLDLYARLSNRTGSNALDQDAGADWSKEGSFHIHSGGK